MHADRNERTNERSVRPKIDTACARAASEHAIDFRESFSADAFAHWSAFGKSTQRGAHATRINERRGGAGRLLLSAATNATGAFGVEH